MRFKLCLVTAFLVASAVAKTFQFTVPLSDLQEWAGVVLTTRAAQVTGHSGVHLAVKDCEMHFGGTVTDYAGTPDGWVFEPMNVCVEPFFGKSKQTNKDWTAYGDDVLNNQKGLSLTGVPRIWPEHLTGPVEDSNPNHALELHPLIRLERDADEARDFASFVHATEALAGISETT